MIKNNEGFIEPKIDEKKCVNCGICLKKCPQNNEIKRNEVIKCYAAKNNNKLELREGSSGSIFKIIADYILDNEGIVYGVTFNNSMEANTIRIEKKEDVWKLMGSKYVQSNTNTTYYLAKKDLEKGKNVLFTGTPCQIAGLKSYLNKEYDSLITIDLVCHGVPSPKLFKKYIKSIEEKNKSKVKEYYFRNKEKNGWGLNSKILFENGKTRYVSANLDPYYKSFLEAKTYREVCYNCKYANTKRVGDITLADYWGIEREHPKFYNELGVSAILINTEKGKVIYEKIKAKIDCIDTDIEKIKKKNKNLIEPSNRTQLRDVIYKNIDNSSFEKYVKKSLKFKKEGKDILKSIIPHSIKKIVKKALNGG